MRQTEQILPLLLYGVIDITTRWSILLSLRLSNFIVVAIKPPCICWIIVPTRIRATTADGAVVAVGMVMSIVIASEDRGCIYGQETGMGVMVVYCWSNINADADADVVVVCWDREVVAAMVGMDDYFLKLVLFAGEELWPTYNRRSLEGVGVTLAHG